jgi:DNA repair protein RadA/Sms
MGKLKSVFVCTECGYENARWIGKCPDCGQWNSLTEEIHEEKNNIKTSSFASISTSTVELLDDIRAGDELRWNIGMSEFNRVLGGGLVPGSVVLISGDPGIGKSTLLLQICRTLSNTHTVLYITGEESAKQIKLRAKRIGVSGNGLYICAETDIARVAATIESTKAQVVIVDSIQTMNADELSSASGSVSQTRECAQRLIKIAKSNEVPIFFVGHVNKDGAIAGPKVLEHMVDAVLYFEGERHLPYRILRSIKNRYGSTNEIGVFEMTETGLLQVENPSMMLLSGRLQDISGTCVTCLMEGTRPILTEIQALIGKSSYPVPKRVANGFEFNRISMLMAVLEKRYGLNFSSLDIYLNVVGGLKIMETSSDLAIITALLSNLYDKPLPHDLVVFGEIGLTGEIRPVGHILSRVGECARLGFKKIVLPRQNLKRLSAQNNLGVDFIAVDRISELKSLFDSVFK